MSPCTCRTPRSISWPGFAVWISRSVWQAEEAVANLPLRLAVRAHCGQPSVAGYSRGTHSLQGHAGVLTALMTELRRGLAQPGLLGCARRRRRYGIGDVRSNYGRKTQLSCRVATLRCPLQPRTGGCQLGVAVQGLSSSRVPPTETEQCPSSSSWELVIPEETRVGK